MTVPKHFGRTVLTGGGVGSLDAIDGARLADGDTCEVITSAAIRYDYRLNATSGAAESSPNTIAPDTNPGSKRWILVGTTAQDITSGASPTFITVKLTGLTDGYIPKHTSDATGFENSPMRTDGTNVSIGAAPGTAKLHVSVGDVYVDRDVTNGAASGQLTLRGATNVNKQLFVGYDEFHNYGSMQAIEQGVAVRALSLQPAGGNVGVWTTTPANPLAVNRNTDDGVIIDLEQADAVEGTISVMGNTVSYNAFVGSHYVQLKPGQAEPPIGAVVISTGEIIPCGVANKEYFPFVSTTDKKADKRVYGTWLGKMSDTSKGMSFGDDDKPVYLVAQVGLFKIRVTDTNGDIENGDFLETSIRPSEAQRQKQVTKMAHTIAKSVVDVNWKNESIDEKVGYKWKLIPCTF